MDTFSFPKRLSLEELYGEKLLVLPWENSIVLPSYSTRTPLRYPGGKTRAVDILARFIPPNTKEVCSPFFGGGSFELSCASKGIKIHGYDIFTPLVEFWQELLKSPSSLAQEVEKYHPLAREAFYDLQKKQMFFSETRERAAVFYALNRASFSGATLSGGMSPGHPRFIPSSIERIRRFFNPNITVQFGDFTESISSHLDVFLYLDPPYLIKNHLYGKKGDAHKDFDHLLLRHILGKRENWILSYNNSPEILSLYKGYKTLFPNWKYGMSNDKDSKEVLILSKDIQVYYGL